jgi:hypothetical protein
MAALEKELRKETGYTDKIKLTIAQMLVTITDSAMKSIDPEAIDQLPGIPLKKDDTFNFRCHSRPNLLQPMLPEPEPVSLSL